MITSHEMVATRTVAEEAANNEAFNAFLVNCLMRYFNHDYGKTEPWENDEYSIWGTYDIPESIGTEYSELWIMGSLADCGKSSRYYQTTVIFPEEY